MKNNPPRKHHYVPECYLCQFLVNDQFFTLDVVKVLKGYKEKPKKNHPGGICYFPNYYTITENLDNASFNLAQHDRLHIETNVLGKLENRYGALFDQLTNTGAFSLEEAIDFIDFVIQMKLRNPYWEEHTLNKKKEEMLDSAMENFYEKDFAINPLYANIPFETRKTLLDQLKAKNMANPNFSKEMQLFSLVNREQNLEERNKQFREILIDCEWIIFQAPTSGPYFVTSDNPGYTKKKDNLIYNTNFEGQFMFFFPLSPNYCLVISNEQKDNCFTEQKPKKKILMGTISPEIVLTINDNSIQCINKLLIAKDDWYLSKIAQINNPNQK